jgi:hypothetical protein
LQELELKYNYMMKNLEELDSSGWAIDKEKNGITVKYKF